VRGANLQAGHVSESSLQEPMDTTRLLVNQIVRELNTLQFQKDNLSSKKDEVQVHSHLLRRRIQKLLAV
jgi:hypothetical protein